MRVSFESIEPQHLGGRVLFDAAQNRTWSVILDRLTPLHQQFACRQYLDGARALGMPRHTIPELDVLSAKLHQLSGYVIDTVPGMVDARTFLTSLGRGVMLSTTYIRDGANPDYTPQPDIVHEIVGHVPLLLDPELCALLKLFGDAAASANEQQMAMLERLYWFTIEFGLIEQDGLVKAWGAGLLSSIGELPHAYSAATTLLPFDAALAANTSYDHTQMQATLLVASSLPAVETDVRDFLQSDAYRDA